VAKKVLTLGGVMQDIFIDFDDPYMLHMHIKDREQSFIVLEEGKKITVDDVHTFVGGGAANAAVSFKRLGLDVECFFKIGADHAGDFILEHLAKEQVKTAHVIRTKEAQTGTSFIIPSPSGNKAALVYRGANLTMKKKEIPFDAIDEADLVYITSLSFSLSPLLPLIAAYAKKNKTLVATNPGSNQVRNGAHDLVKALSNIDILILNSYEAKQLMVSLVSANPSLQRELSQEKEVKTTKKVPTLLRSPLTFQQVCFSLPQYFQEILSHGPKIALVTNGAEGVYAASQDTIYFYPSPKIKVVSTVGAGDSFASAFVASLLQGKTIEDALVAGTLNSSSVLGHIGTHTGLLTEKELGGRLKEANSKLLQKFKL